MQTIDQWLFSLVKRSANRQAAQQNESELIFRLCWQIRVAAVFVVVGLGGFLVFVMLSPPIAGDPWYLRPILVSFIGAIPASLLLALPGHVVTDFAGIRQRYWWRSEKRLAWTDVVSVARNDEKGETIVYGRFSPPIVFSPYLVARSRFELEVRTHSRRTDPATDQ
jgi:hypothetical protein